MSDVLSIPDSRQDPPSGQDERTTLIDFLDLYRETVLVKLDGLDREAVTRRPLPSYTSLLGIVRHLIRVEIYWYSTIFLGEPLDDAYADSDPNDDWIVGDDETPEQLIAEYRSVWARSNEIARGAPSLDEVSRSQSLGWQDAPLDSRAHGRRDGAPRGPCRHRARAHRRPHRRMRSAPWHG